jgi:hypothetical protein
MTDKVLQELYDNLDNSDRALWDELKQKQHLKNRLHMGNSKINKKVGIFNLQAVKDCGNCSTCKDTCYAKQREMYANVRNSRSLNSTIVMNHPDLFIYLLYRQITKQKIQIVRFHESGDFIDSNHIDIIGELCSLLPDVQFYAYTKMFDKYPLGLDQLNKLNNVNIINSLIDNKYRNYGSKEYITHLKDKYNVFICPHDPHKKDGVGCMSDCTYCLSGNRVAFEIHGNYKTKDNYIAVIEPKQYKRQYKIDRYIGNCTQLSASTIDSMMYRAKEISRHGYYANLLAEGWGWTPFTVRDDYAPHLYRTIYKGEEYLIFEHSRIEYVYRLREVK